MCGYHGVHPGMSQVTTRSWNRLGVLHGARGRFTLYACYKVFQRHSTNMLQPAEYRDGMRAVYVGLGLFKGLTASLHHLFYISNMWG